MAATCGGLTSLRVNKCGEVERRTRLDLGALPRSKLAQAMKATK